ncbi:MAG: response regulator [Selenomonadaceae bacterium]|nr:response regulator [Selenomonadaceae bacterium]
MAENDNKTVLIVDDDDMMRHMAEFILKKDTEYRILKANSAVQALRILQSGEETIDLILLDIQMPGMDGIKAMELIQKHDYWKKIPVIFLTASSDRDTVVKAGKLGAAGYVKKPFEPKDLLQRVVVTLELGKL